MWVVLFAMGLYGLFHSILASREFKNAIKHRVGDQVYHGFYRLFFNVVAVVTFAPIAGLIVFREGNRVWQIDLQYEPLLLIVQVIGVLGFVVSLLQIDLSRFAGVRQAMAYFNDEPLPLADESLTTTGVYRLVRHPLYLFSLMLIWPVTTMTEAYLGFAIGATVYFLVGSIYEERRMLQNFGEAYQTYRERVPWMIPFLRFSNNS